MKFEEVTIGDARLIRGDCFDVMPSLPATSVDLILCDLPYGVTDCKWDTPLQFESLWDNYRRLLKPKGAVVLTASQPFTSMLVMSNLRQFKAEWIWEKNAGSNFGTVKWQPMKEHESVLVFSAGTPYYSPIMEQRAPSGAARVKTLVNYDTKSEVFQNGALNKQVSSIRPALRYPRSIQKFNRERGLHPTQKPVPLMVYLMKTYSPEGATVLDNCMGSGTTGVACSETGRKFIGIEIDAKHFEVSRKRIEAASGTFKDALDHMGYIGGLFV